MPHPLSNSVLSFAALAVIALVALTALTTPLWATQPRQAREVLEAMGFTEVATHGYGFFACGKDDLWATKFTAYNRQSQRYVRGVVCAGLFKGQTVRVTGVGL